jgi:hypothetical protein
MRNKIQKYWEIIKVYLTSKMYKLTKKIIIMQKN